MNKTYYFIADYTTKYGVVKAGESLTGKTINKAGIPIILFKFYETKNNNKEIGQLGEGDFTIKEADLGKIATDIKPTDIKPNDSNASELKKANENTDTTKSGWKSYSSTKKGLIIGGYIAVLLGVVGVIYYIKKNK